MIDIFIPSYKRANNLKTVKFFSWYDMSKIHVVIDSEAEDKGLYEKQAEKVGFNLHVFDMDKSRERYDYVHRASESRRSGGQSRNMIYDIAKELGIEFFMVQDDDTNGFEIRPFCVYMRMAERKEILDTFYLIKDFMQRKKIGCFGLSQTGEMFERYSEKLMRFKVMNTTFYDSRFIYRGERGVQDNDTSQFTGILNAGLFTGSMYSGIVLKQTPSAKAKGGLTELYNENKLLNKAIIVPIQYPSAVRAEKQKMNGNRLHHRIFYRYLAPKVIKGERNNIAWDTYPEDVPFTLEPKRDKK